MFSISHKFNWINSNVSFEKIIPRQTKPKKNPRADVISNQTKVSKNDGNINVCTI